MVTEICAVKDLVLFKSLSLKFVDMGIVQIEDCLYILPVYIDPDRLKADC